MWSMKKIIKYEKTMSAWESSKKLCSWENSFPGKSSKNQTEYSHLNCRSIQNTCFYYTRVFQKEKLLFPTRVLSFEHAALFPFFQHLNLDSSISVEFPEERIEGNYLVPGNSYKNGLFESFSIEPGTKFLAPFPWNYLERWLQWIRTFLHNCSLL
jgi:hypothetical protein